MNKILFLLILLPLALVLSKQVFGEGEGEVVRKSITPKGASVLARYSSAIDYRGNLLFVSGQLPYTDGKVPDYALDGENDIQDQAKIVMENIGAILKEAGYGFDDVLKVSVFLADIRDYKGFNEVYATYWPGPAMPPAREAVQVAALPGSTLNAPISVEVSLIAGK